MLFYHRITSLHSKLLIPISHGVHGYQTALRSGKCSQILFTHYRDINISDHYRDINTCTSDNRITKHRDLNNKHNMLWYVHNIPFVLILYISVNTDM